MIFYFKINQMKMNYINFINITIIKFLIRYKTIDILHIKIIHNTKK